MQQQSRSLRAFAATGRAVARAIALSVGLAGGLLLAGPVARAADATPAHRVVNVNTAGLEELQALPGVGEARARAILEARKSRGGFKRVEDLLEVKGIGRSALERMRPFLTLEGRTTAPGR
jgi:competence protein ComEA